MDVGPELHHLAHLLRVSASTARDLADLRQSDLNEIYQLAKTAESIADQLDRIADKPAKGVNGNA